MFPLQVLQHSNRCQLANLMLLLLPLLLAPVALVGVADAAVAVAAAAAKIVETVFRAGNQQHSVAYCCMCFQECLCSVGNGTHRHRCCCCFCCCRVSVYAAAVRNLRAAVAADVWDKQQDEEANRKHVSNCLHLTSGSHPAGPWLVK